MGDTEDNKLVLPDPVEDAAELSDSILDSHENSMIDPSPAGQTIVGREANPFEAEDWADDFDEELTAADVTTGKFERTASFARSKTSLVGTPREEKKSSPRKKKMELDLDLDLDLAGLSDDDLEVTAETARATIQARGGYYKGQSAPPPEVDAGGGVTASPAASQLSLPTSDVISPPKKQEYSLELEFSDDESLPDEDDDDQAGLDDAVSSAVSSPPPSLPPPDSPTAPSAVSSAGVAPTPPPTGVSLHALVEDDDDESGFAELEEALQDAAREEKEEEEDWGDSDEDEDWDAEIAEELGIEVKPTTALDRAMEEEASDESSDAGFGSDDDDDDDGSDWDAEFAEDIASAPTTHVDLRSMLKDDSDDDEEDKSSIPAAYRLLKILGREDRHKVKIVMYPQPSRLLTLKTKNNLAALPERELEKWIQTLTSKHKDFLNYDSLPSWSGREFTYFREQPEYVISASGQTQPRDITPVLISCLRHMQRLNRQRADVATESLWEIFKCVNDFFTNELAAYRDKLPQTERKNPYEASLYVKMNLRRATSGPPALVTTAGQVMPHDFNEERVFRLVESLLYVASKSFHHSPTAERRKELDRALRLAQDFFPSYTALVELLDLESRVHHSADKGNMAMRRFAELYHRYTLLADEYKDQPPAIAICCEVRARALCSLHLYLNEYSPLNADELAPHAKWDLEDARFEWLECAILGDPIPDNASELERATWALCADLDRRINLLTDLYKELPSNLRIKALCAFTLARYHYGTRQDERESEDVVPLAESMVFEALYVLDQTPILFENQVPVLSQLGVAALVLYGDILVSGNKYKYGILAYEAALRAYKLTKGVEYYKLIRRLCDICTEHEDFKRSITYHQATKDKSIRDGNLNMFLYIVQQLSKVQLAKGSFAKAEEALRDALSFLQPLSNQVRRSEEHNTTSQQVRMRRQRSATMGARSHSKAADKLKGLGGANTLGDNWKFSTTPHAEFRVAIYNLYIALARLYLNGDRIGSAIHVLEHLKGKKDLPKNKVAPTFMLLATAYMKKRKFEQATRLIGEIEAKAREQGATGPVPGSPTQRMLTAQFTPSLGMTFAEVVHSFAFVELRTKTFLYSGNYSYALRGVDAAIAATPTNNLTQLARFHYRKGKIFQAMMYSEMMDAPVGLGKDHPDTPSDYSDNSSGGDPATPNGGSFKGKKRSISASLVGGYAAPLPNLPNPHSCISEFTEAYEYYKRVDDNLRMAKALCRIVETYLHVAMVSVAVLCHTPAELIPWLRTAVPDLDFDASVDSIWAEFLEERVEGPALHALELSAEALDAVLLLKCYINLAELRLLQEKFEAALAFWRECKETFYALFMNGSACVLVNKSTPGFSANMKTFFKRMVRLMMCFEPSMVNQHLLVLDSYVLYETDLFSELLASHDDEKKKDDDDTTKKGVGGLRARRAMRRAAQGQWRGKLDAAFGAVGSRAQGGINRKRISHMSARFSDDDDVQLRAMHMAESVCFALYEVQRACHMYSVGKYTAQDVCRRNRTTLRKILRTMVHLRQDSGNENQSLYGFGAHAGGSVSSDRSGRRSSLEDLERRLTTDREKRSSIVINRALQRINNPKGWSGRASSMWMLSARSNGDPLWGNLIYCIPMSNVILMYSPLAETKLIRSFAQVRSVFDIINQVSGSMSMSSSRSLFGSNGNLSRESSTGTSPANSLGSLTSAHSRKDSVMHIDPELQKSGPVLAHRHPGLTHTIPSAAFMAAMMADFQQRAEPVLAAKAAGSARPSMAVGADEDEDNDEDDFGQGQMDLKGLGDAPNGGRDSSNDDAPLPRTPNNTSHLNSTTPQPTERPVPNEDTPEDQRRRRREKSVMLAASALEKLHTDIGVGHKKQLSSSGLETGRLGVSHQRMASTSRARGVSASLQEPVSREELEASDSDSDFDPNEDPPACLDCGCQWFTDHYWDRGLCRNCFHNHITSVLAPEDIKEEDPHTPRKKKRVHQARATLPPITASFATIQQTQELGLRRDPTSQLTIRAADSLLPRALDLSLVREMFSALDPQNILTLFAALFGECRIIFSASSHFRIKAVINSLLRLMYPFQWQHMFIPVLARECVGVLQVPDPYIIGINSYILDLVTPPPGVVIAHLDKNFVKYSPGTFTNFPPAHKSLLYKTIVAFMSKMFVYNAQNKAGYDKAQKQSNSPTHESVTLKRPSLADDRMASGLPPQAATVLPDRESRGISITISRAGDDRPSVSRPHHHVRRSISLSQHTMRGVEVLKILRNGFLHVMVALFWKYRLFWRAAGGIPLELGEFLENTEQEAQPFVQSFVRTKSFRQFVAVRAAMKTSKLNKYLFDNLVEQRIIERSLQNNKLRHTSQSGQLLFSKGSSSSWHKRHIVLEKNDLKIFKNAKKSTPKYTRDLVPGVWRVVVPVIESNPNFFSFELVDMRSPQQEPSWYFRASSLKLRKQWLRHLECRLIEKVMQDRYLVATENFSPRQAIHCPAPMFSGRHLQDSHSHSAGGQSGYHTPDSEDNSLHSFVDMEDTELTSFFSDDDA